MQLIEINESETCFNACPKLVSIENLMRNLPTHTLVP